jgi:hypothetical protein
MLVRLKWGEIGGEKYLHRTMAVTVFPSSSSDDILGDTGMINLSAPNTTSVRDVLPLPPAGDGEGKEAKGWFVHMGETEVYMPSPEDMPLLNRTQDSLAAAAGGAGVEVVVHLGWAYGATDVGTMVSRGDRDFSRTEQRARRVARAVVLGLLHIQGLPIDAPYDGALIENAPSVTLHGARTLSDAAVCRLVAIANEKCTVVLVGGDSVAVLTAAEVQSAIGDLSYSDIVDALQAKGDDITFRVRKTCPDTGFAVPLHVDVSRRTVVVALTSDTDIDGGHLVYSTQGKDVRVRRRAGYMVSHDWCVPHRVDEVVQGVRYTLYATSEEKTIDNCPFARAMHIILCGGGGGGGGIACT